jgi:signal peptidase I/deoxyribose-phosphate aldolase
VALLGATLLLAVVCLVLPKTLGAVPLTILSGSMAPMMPPGALAVVRPVDATRARVGDILSYQPEPDDPMLVTHRVVAVSKNAHGNVSLTLQGDANNAPDPHPVRPGQVQGSVVYAVPYFGWVATRLNVGGGAKCARWAAYALIAVGSLRILIGLGGLIPRGGFRITGDRGRTSRRRDFMMTEALSVVPRPATGPARDLRQLSWVVRLGKGPHTVAREQVPGLAYGGKDDDGEDSHPGGRPCAPRDFGTHGGAAPLMRQRQALSVGAVAARLEHRLYTSESSRQGVEDGCELAIRRGLSSVIVPPEVVSLVGLHLAGTSVGLVTLVGWRNGEVEPLAARALRAEAWRLVAEGATDVGVLANVERLEADRGRLFANEVTAMVQVVQACGARVRVVLDTDGQTPAATAAACELLGATGAWLVQGGSWRGGRTSLSRIQLMRAALPDEVRLKWTLPLRGLDSMMIGMAEGVDLFNGDTESLLDDAAQRVAARPLLVPLRGVDY